MTHIEEESRFEVIFGAIRRFHSSDAIRSLLKNVAYFGLYTLILVVIESNFYPIKVNIDTILISLLGTLLSLLLVFRTNTAYDRFWEGRKLWGGLINNSRSFAMMVGAMLPAEDVENRRFFAKYLPAFAFGLKNHLRDTAHYEEFEGMDEAFVTRLRNVLHVPNAIASELFSRLEMLYRTDVLTGHDLRNIKPQHDAFVDITGACERIKRTPIPYSYGFYIKLFITVYLGMIPLLLMDKYSYYTIPAVMFAAYALMGLEAIASEIEEPFGLDTNDLPLDQMARTIYLNVHEILNVEMKS
jgi:ion channel-forming bestrophin family protein